MKDHSLPRASEVRNQFLLGSATATTLIPAEPSREDVRSFQIWGMLPAQGGQHLLSEAFGFRAGDAIRKVSHLPLGATLRIARFLVIYLRRVHATGFARSFGDLGARCEL